MAKLSLVVREIVDRRGPIARHNSDIEQLGITKEELADLNKTGAIPAGFKDLGLVEYQGVEYYASIIYRPITEVEE